MKFEYNSSCDLAVSGDYKALAESFAQALNAYQENPRFCVPSEVCELFDKQGAATKVVILGTPLFSSIIALQSGAKVDIVGVVDDFKAKDGAEFHGYPVITSKAFEALAVDNNVVAINGCRTDYSRRYFKSLARKLSVPMLSYEQAMRWLSIETEDPRIADWGSYIYDNADELVRFSERLVDDYSRFTLFSVLLSHLTCDLEWTLNACKPYASLYFRSGLWAPSRTERFADCGASIAESTNAFLDATDGVFEKIWMIEPDEINQKTLVSYIDAYESAALAEQKGKIELIRCAISNEDGELPFLHEGGHNGHLLITAAQQGECKNVQLRRLDDILDETPTLIKMDIEGAELDALKGAEQHIISGKPKLAISAYHRKSDLLEITRYIESLRGDYKIGLRHHTEERWDTCLYFY